MSDELHWQSATELGGGDPLHARCRPARCSTTSSTGSDASTARSMPWCVRSRPGRRGGRCRRCRRRAAAMTVGPLHGVPMTIKDSFSTEGCVTTSGAPDLADHVPTADAWPVARLREAGAIPFAKTNLPIFAGDIQSFNEVYGTTNNPYDRRPDVRRIVGRGRGRAGDGVHADRAGLRHRRVDPRAGALLGRRRPQVELRARARARPDPRDAGHAQPGRPRRRGADGAHRRRPRAGADRARRPRPVEAPAWRVELPPPRATDARRPADRRVARRRALPGRRRRPAGCWARSSRRSSTPAAASTPRRPAGLHARRRRPRCSSSCCSLRSPASTRGRRSSTWPRTPTSRRSAG